MQPEPTDVGVQLEGREARSAGVVVVCVPGQPKHHQRLNSPLARGHAQHVAMESRDLGLKRIDRHLEFLGAVEQIGPGDPNEKRRHRPQFCEPPGQRRAEARPHHQRQVACSIAVTRPARRRALLDRGRLRNPDEVNDMPLPGAPLGVVAHVRPSFGRDQHLAALGQGGALRDFDNAGSGQDYATVGGRRAQVDEVDRPGGNPRA